MLSGLLLALAAVGAHAEEPNKINTPPPRGVVARSPLDGAPDGPFVWYHDGGQLRVPGLADVLRISVGGSQ